MKPQFISRIIPFLLLALFAALIAPLLPGGHAHAQQTLTATPTATPAPPAIPGNFSGAVTNNGIALSWTAPEGGTATYTIHRTWPRHSKYGTSVLYILGSSTSYTDSDVAVAGTYSYQIQASRGELTSGWSSTLNVVVPESVIPTATGTPVPSTATPTGTPTPTATSTATPTNVPPGFPTLTPTATPTLTATPTSTPIGLPTATPTATPAAPAIPGDFTGTVTNNGIVLSWTAPEGGADSYWIYRSWPRHSKDGTIVSYRPPGSATSYTDSDVAVPGGHYRYNIQALRGVRGSGWSDLLTVVVPESANATATATSTPTPTSALSVPTLTATSTPTPTSVGRQPRSNGASEQTAPTPTPTSALSVPTLTAQAGADAVELSWAAVAGAARYELWTWWNGGAGWQRLDVGSLTGTSYTHSGLSAGTTYYYAIRAVDASDLTSAWSEYASAIVSAPTAPALKAEAGPGQVTLTWNAVAGAVRYELWGWWDEETGWQRIDDGSLTGTTHTHSGLVAGTTYYYAIRAVDANDAASGWSEYASAVAGAAQN